MYTIDVHETTREAQSIQIKKGKIFKVPASKRTKQSWTMRSNSICQQSAQIQGKKQLFLPFLDNSSIKVKRRLANKSYLQQWLDSVLQQQSKKGPLGTLRKYEVDKRFLISQNLSAEKIDNLYHGLYIYSFGFKKVLSEILQLRQDLVLKFWKVYLKLLQKSSECTTIFTMSELRNSQNLEDIRLKIHEKEIQIDKLTKQYQFRLQQNAKQIKFKDNKIDQLRNQIKVLQSNNLALDDSLISETSLRLKFEAKINSINTTYSELKIKFERLVEELQSRKLEMVKCKQYESQLIAKVQTSEFKIEQLQKQLMDSKQKIQHKSREIVQINQQFNDIKSNQLKTDKQQMMKQNQIKKLVAKIKNISIRLHEESQKNRILQNSVTQKSVQVTKLVETNRFQTEMLDKYSKKNIMLNNKLNELESIMSDQTIKYSDLKLEYENVKSTLSAYLSQRLEKIQINKKYSQETQCLLTKNKLLEDMLQQNSKVVAELRLVKEKYEKSNRMLQEQFDQSQVALKESIKKTNDQAETIRGNMLVLQSKDYNLNQLEIQHKSQRNIMKSKIEGLMSQLKIEQTERLKMEEKQMNSKKQIASKNSEIQRAKGQIQRLQAEYRQKQIQIKALQSKAQILVQELNFYKQKSQNYQKKLAEVSEKQSKASNRNQVISFILEQKQSKTSTQLNLLKTTLENYKNFINERTEFIHPMLYWDLQAKVHRFVETLKQRQKNVGGVLKNYQELQIRLKQAERALQFFKQGSVERQKQLKMQLIEQNNKFCKFQSEMELILHDTQEGLHQKQAELQAVKQDYEILKQSYDSMIYTKDSAIGISIQTQLQIRQHSAQVDIKNNVQDKSIQAQIIQKQIIQQHILKQQLPITIEENKITSQKQIKNQTESSPRRIANPVTNQQFKIALKLATLRK